VILLAPITTEQSPLAPVSPSYSNYVLVRSSTQVLQFAFKKGRGCRDAIFTLRGIITHITSNSSTATLCALDVAKAFDKTNHFGLYMKLMDRHPTAISECSH